MAPKLPHSLLQSRPNLELASCVADGCKPGSECVSDRQKKR
jgi:hypothetical protein